MISGVDEANVVLVFEPEDGIIRCPVLSLEDDPPRLAGLMASSEIRAHRESIIRYCGAGYGKKKPPFGGEKIDQRMTSL